MFKKSNLKKRNNHSFITQRGTIVIIPNINYLSDLKYEENEIYFLVNGEDMKFVYHINEKEQAEDTRNHILYMIDEYWNNQSINGINTNE